MSVEICLFLQNLNDNFSFLSSVSVLILQEIGIKLELQKKGKNEAE